MPSLSIILVYTKVPRSTKKMVSGVKERYDAVSFHRLQSCFNVSSIQL